MQPGKEPQGSRISRLSSYNKRVVVAGLPGLCVLTQTQHESLAYYPGEFS
jgi:hypothetical protein